MVSQKHKYCKNFLRNSHWRNLSMIMWWERYSNASPKPDFFLFSLFIFSFISQLIWIRLGWNFHRWFSIQERVNWCTIDPFSLYFCTSQHSYPVPLMHISLSYNFFFCRLFCSPRGRGSTCLISGSSSMASMCRWRSNIFSINFNQCTLLFCF